VRLVNDLQGESSSRSAAVAVVAKQLGVGKESVLRWVIQGQIDGGHGIPGGRQARGIAKTEGLSFLCGRDPRVASCRIHPGHLGSEV